jgi:hypothetical protein
MEEGLLSFGSACMRPRRYLSASPALEAPHVRPLLPLRPTFSEDRLTSAGSFASALLTPAGTLPSDASSRPTSSIRPSPPRPMTPLVGVLPSSKSGFPLELEVRRWPATTAAATEAVATAMVEEEEAEPATASGSFVVLARLEVDRLPMRDPAVLTDVKHLDCVLLSTPKAVMISEGYRCKYRKGSRRDGPSTSACPSP